VWYFLHDNSNDLSYYINYELAIPKGKWNLLTQNYYIGRFCTILTLDFALGTLKSNNNLSVCIITRTSFTSVFYFFLPQGFVYEWKRSPFLFYIDVHINSCSCWSKFAALFGMPRFKLYFKTTKIPIIMYQSCNNGKVQ
jgi:hypothetical protein